MEFEKRRMARLAGLLRENAEYTNEADEAEEMDEADEVDEAEEMEETYEVSESDLQELEESFDLRKVIRDEISKSLRNRNKSTYEWTSGQVHGRKTRAKTGSVTMGFPGIGFRR